MTCCIANLDTSLSRRAPAEDAAEILPEFPDGLTTAEVAQIMAEDKYAWDLDAAEDALIALTASGQREAPLLRARRALGARGGRGGEARRRGAEQAPSYGFVVDRVNVSVLLYVPVRNASLP